VKGVKGVTGAGWLEQSQPAPAAVL